MTIEEFYDKAVSIYQKNGQGLPYKLMKPYHHLANELINMGLLKIIINRYNHLPDDEWLCLTNVICPEESMSQKDSSVLHFLRYYLGVKEDGIFANIPKNDDFQTKYKIWLEDNREELEKIPSLPKFNDLNKTNVININIDEYEDVIKECKNTNRYSNNDKVSNIIFNCDEKLSLYDKLIPLMKQINSIDLTKTLKERDDVIKLKNLLKTFSSNTPIQECF